MTTSIPTKFASDSLDSGVPIDIAGRLRDGDRDRFLCTLFAPADRRAALVALYAFNLEIGRVRESVSDPMVGQLRLKWWHEAISNIDTGQIPKHPLVLAVADAVANFGLEADNLLAMIEARADDLQPRRPADMAALETYANETATILSMAALPILGAAVHGPTHDAVGHVGIAWAYTGLLRALPHHAAEGRIYLPDDLCRRHQLEPADVLRTRFGNPSPDGLNVAVREIATEARRHIATARARPQELASEALPVLLPAVLADHYLKLLERTGYDATREEFARHGPGTWATANLGWHAFRRKF